MERILLLERLMLSGLVMKENFLSIEEGQSGWKTAPWRYSQSLAKSGLWLMKNSEGVQDQRNLLL